MTQKEGISPREVFCRNPSVLPGYNERYAVFLCGETLSRGPLKCEPRVFKMSHYVKKEKKPIRPQGTFFPRIPAGLEVATYDVYDVSE